MQDIIFLASLRFCVRSKLSLSRNFFELLLEDLQFLSQLDSVWQPVPCLNYRYSYSTGFFPYVSPCVSLFCLLILTSTVEVVYYICTFLGPIPASNLSSVISAGPPIRFGTY
jgi:hypothetical protein